MWWVSQDKWLVFVVITWVSCPSVFRVAVSCSCSTGTGCHSFRPRWPSVSSHPRNYARRSHEEMHAKSIYSSLYIFFLSQCAFTHIWIDDNNINKNISYNTYHFITVLWLLCSKNDQFYIKRINKNFFNEIIWQLVGARIDCHLHSHLLWTRLKYLKARKLYIAHNFVMII